MLLFELRKIDPASADLDESVAALAVLRMTALEYNNQGVPAPDWVTERIADLDREVKLRKRDYLQAQLKKAQARQATLKTREERAKDTQDEIERLQKLLAQ